MNANEILQAKARGLDGATPDVQKMALEEVKVFIKNYCRISYVPTELNFVWANMAFDLLQGAYLRESTMGDAISPTEASSMTVGDMSISRGSDTINHKITLDDLLLNYKDQLNKWRRIDWGLSPRCCWGG